MNPKSHPLLPFGFLVLTLLLGTCNPPKPVPVINITAPAENEYIPNDYTINIENVDRYDELIAGTFQAWLDPGTGKEKEITNGFTYDGSTKTWSSSLNLDTGAHELVAQAKYAYPDDPVSTSRKFIVFQTTCVTGKVQIFFTDETKLDPFEGANLEIYIGTTKQFIATGNTNKEGIYCIDGVPAAVPLKFFFSSHQVCSTGSYSSEKTIENIILTDPYKSCPVECNVVEDIHIICNEG
jgi:hypothetical protein